MDHQNFRYQAKPFRFRRYGRMLLNQDLTTSYDVDLSIVTSLQQSRAKAGLCDSRVISIGRRHSKHREKSILIDSLDLIDSFGFALSNNRMDKFSTRHNRHWTVTDYD